MATERAERRQIQRNAKRHRMHWRYERPFPEQPVRHDMIPQIKHIVVLMMENHSFDNYLGMLNRPGVEGFAIGSGGPVETNPSSHGEVSLEHATDPHQYAHVPTQSWRASHLQWNEGTNAGFVTSEEEFAGYEDITRSRAGMRYWTKDVLRFYDALATMFPVADHWYSSCLGPTFPNRRFLIAGTAHGLIDDLPFTMLDAPESGTVFDLLTHHRINWVNYHSGSRLRTEVGGLLGPVARSVRSIGAVLVHAFPRLAGALFSKLQFTAALYPLEFWSVHNHIRSHARFFKDAAEGKLPPVSFVDPDFRTCSEENPQDIDVGEGFAAAVINAVMMGKCWKDTLLVWTFDEHGGYYDHVCPPDAPAPDDVEPRSILGAPLPLRWLLVVLGQWKKVKLADDFLASYNRYGFRVPAVIVSPNAKRDYVCKQVYDHTSILKLIEHKWNLPSLTARDFRANDFMEALDLEGPGPFADPPQLAEPSTPWSRTHAFASRLKRVTRIR